ETFNSALWGALAIAGIQIPLLFLMSSNLSFFLDVPEGFQSDVEILILLTTVSFLISCVAGIFNSKFYALNRLDIHKTLDLTRV
ncbi:hypothetical protein, partial [Roseivirga sp.]|uniref:hypothetical protein n=1 Tax=Roseivirga sp. TaxID=1964215 RepID=UPI002355EAAC